MNNGITGRVFVNIRLADDIDGSVIMKKEIKQLVDLSRKPPTPT